MGTSLEITAYGPPATARLHAVIAAAKRDDPLAPVTVIVPANSVGVSVRRRLASGDLPPITAGTLGVAGLALLTVYRLAELLGAPSLAASGRRPVSTPVVAAAVRAVLADDPGLFRSVAEHPATEEALVAAHRELSTVTDPALDAVAGASARAGDVVRVHRAVRDRLAERWYDETALLVAATAAVERGDPVATSLGTAVLHLPQTLTPGAAGLLRAIGDRSELVVVAGTTGDRAADADVRTALARLGLDLPAPDVADPPPVSPGRTRLVSVSDAEEEVRSAVDAITDATRRGVPLERIGVLYPTREPYARLVHEQFAAAGIHHNGPGVRPVADRHAGRWLLDALALPERDFARDAVMALLMTGPVRAADGDRIRSSSWDRDSRDAGVVGTREQWEARLTAYAGTLRARADEYEDVRAEDPDAAPDPTWLRERADEVDRLRDTVRTIASGLDAVAAAPSWSGMASAARALLVHHIGGPEHRGHWPDEERLAAERVEAALDRLTLLDEVDADADLDVFRRTLAVELEDDLGRVGRLGEGVLATTLAGAVGFDLDVVVVLGSSEGILPTRPREDPLLADRERGEAGGELPRRRDRVHTQHRHLRIALATAREHVLVHPRGDLRRNVTHAPSRWILDVAAALGADGPRILDRTDPCTTVVPSFAHRGTGEVAPTTRQLFRLAWIGRSGGRLAGHPLLARDAALRLAKELADARWSRSFTRFDGNLGQAARLVPSIADPATVTSATKVERFLACPSAYLFEHVLRVRPVEAPETILAIGAAERGSLVHEVLDRWIGGEIAARRVPAPDEPWSDEAQGRLAAIAGTVCAEYESAGLTGHPALWARDRARILRDLDRFVRDDDARRRADGSTPISTELIFGRNGRPAIEVQIRGARTVRFAGAADRVDRRGDGGLLVVDYKTGSTRSYRDISAEDPLAGDTLVQLPVYAAAARREHAQPDTPVHAAYWFTSAKGEFVRIGYDVGAAAEAQLDALLSRVVDLMETGTYLSVPEEPTWRPWNACWHCDPDDLGTASAHRRFLRTIQDPALDPLRELLHIEPAVEA